MLLGIDISNHNAVNQPAYKAYDFVIMKASEGRTYKDPLLDQHYDYIHGSSDGKPDKNLLYGFYHYARPENNANPKDEADNFLNLVSHHAGNCLYALDWEGIALTKSIIWARQWLDYVYKQTGVKPLFYCQSSYTKNIQAILNGDYGLWVAHYGVQKPTVHTYPFYAMWQFSSSNGLDKNYFNGTIEMFKKYCARSK